MVTKSLPGDVDKPADFENPFYLGGDSEDDGSPGPIDGSDTESVKPKFIPTFKARYKTGDDGSCGIHALVGKPEKGKYQSAPECRQLFCLWLGARWKEDRLPKEIEHVLDDAFDNLENASMGFGKDIDVIRIRNELRKNYDKLTPKQGDQRKKDFLQNPKVFNAYLNNLAKTNVYLLQDELIAAAIYFEKKLVLYQPDYIWKNGERKIADKKVRSVFNSTGKETVVVFYNGHNHYERAAEELKKID